MNPVVIDAIQALLAEGKTPTVALTKARLASPVPMPVLIAAVSQYKNNPEAFSLLARHTVAAPDQPEEAQQTQLDRIEQKLDRLLTLLEQK